MDRVELSRWRPLLSLQSGRLEDAIGERCVNALDAHSVRQGKVAGVSGGSTPAVIVCRNDEVVDRRNDAVRVTPRDLVCNRVEVDAANGVR